MNLVAVLHNIRSVYNVGSIFRTADGAGMAKIYCCGVTPSPLDRFGALRPDFTKVSLGAEKTMPWEKVAQTGRLIKKLKAEGYRVFAVEQAPGSVPYFSAPRSLTLAPRSCLIMGNEVRGLPPSVLDAADAILEIPMHGAKESLNVSVAFGIVAYHFAAQGNLPDM